jgi:hypothetical protein
MKRVCTGEVFIELLLQPAGCTMEMNGSDDLFSALNEDIPIHKQYC